MPVDLQNLYGGYNRASRYNPVPKTTLRKALRPYKITLGSLKGKADNDLRRMAVQAVIAKRKKPKGK